MSFFGPTNKIVPLVAAAPKETAVKKVAPSLPKGFDKALIE